MRPQKLRLPILVAIAVVCLSTLVWALSIPLNETKDQLGLKYELEATAHGDSVIVELRIEDLGSLKTLSGVMLDVPPKKSGPSELYVRLATTEKDGTIIARAQLSRELAERAEIYLFPETPPDGRKFKGGVFFPIPLKGRIVDAKEHN